MGAESRLSETDERVGEPLSAVQLALLGLVSAVLFALVLLLTESVGEIGTDIDMKPFAIPYLLIALFRFGTPTLSVGLGAAIGEGLLDVVEGYELDDPIGFIGYVVGFIAFGWYLSEVATDPTSARSLTAASLLGALVQATFEGLAFFVFASAADAGPAVLSVVGNTITHGVVLGAVPLVLLLPKVRAWRATRSATVADE